MRTIRYPNFLRRTALTSACVIALAFSAAPANAQSMKIGYVDAEKIIANYEAWKKAEEQFDAQKRAWEQEAEKMYQAYVEDSLEFEKQRLILSSERKLERQSEVSAKRMALDSFTKDIFGPGGVAERKNGELRKPLIDNINLAIQKAATEGNFDIVLNSEAIAFAIPALDISEKVLAILATEG